MHFTLESRFLQEDYKLDHTASVLASFRLTAFVRKPRARAIYGHVSGRRYLYVRVEARNVTLKLIS